jgi:DNA-directed RNA polymerase specialized sigma24 family protein
MTARRAVSFLQEIAMIARAEPTRILHPSQSKFIDMLPAISRSAKLAFANLAGEAREEAVQEIVANSFVAFAALVRQGRESLAFPTVLARYAIAQWIAGRRVGARQNVRDVMSPVAVRQERVVVERLDRFDHEQQAWQEAVVEDTQTPVIDQVCFRIDFPEWLSRLSARDRRIARALAVGHSTSEVATAFGISAGRVSQLRREFHAAWLRFQGESDVNAAAIDELPPDNPWRRADVGRYVPVI